MDVNEVVKDAGIVVAVGKEIRTIVLDIEAIFNRHYMNALNDKVGTAVDHWKHALHEVLHHADIKIEQPAAVAVEEAAPLRTAAEITATALEVRDHAACDDLHSAGGN